MCTIKRMSYWALPVVVGIVCPGALGAAAEGESTTSKPAAETEITAAFTGEVTGSNVYVRCMPDQNWYPTSKLQIGDRVEVCGEKFGWYKIRPPKGSFCYIAKTHLLRDEGNKGVVKGQHVRVRAGSSLPEHERMKNCIAAMLDEGAEVTIIGEHPDGFYKIVPPPGAFYWISAKFVRRADAAAAKPAEGADKPKEETGIGGRLRPGPAPAKPGAPAKPAEPVQLVNVWQSKLDLANAELNVAFRQKPWKEEDFRELRKRFVPIAEQTEEEIPQRFAQIRIGHIDNVLERIAIRKQIEAISTGLDKRVVRTTATKPAAKVTRRPTARADYAGKLVRSFAFEGRYRIVDSSSGKTLAYLEFPPDSGLNPADYVGRLVKIQTRRKYYDKDAGQNVVVPAQIVVASEPLRKLPAQPEPTKQPAAAAPPPKPAPKPAPAPAKEASTRPIGPPTPPAAPTANQPAALDAPEK